MQQCAYHAWIYNIIWMQIGLFNQNYSFSLYCLAFSDGAKPLCSLRFHRDSVHIGLKSICD